MNAPSPCRFLDWDSEFFGLRIASVLATKLDETGMRSVRAWCSAQRIDCLYFLAGDDGPTARLATAHGFRPVDARTTLERDLAAILDAPTSHVRAARAEDVPALRTLASRSHTASRFYADGGFDRERCDELYATWIEKSCKGWADVVFVAESGGRVAGYLSCHRREDGRGEIGLVAVDPAAQGRGLGLELVARALQWFREQGLARASVVTQGANVAAASLYQRAGFRTADVRIWYHKWFDEEHTSQR